MPPKWGKSTDNDQNLISSQGGHDTSAWPIIKSEYNKNLGEESTWSFMPPETLSEKVLLKKNANNSKLQFDQTSNFW